MGKTIGLKQLSQKVYDLTLLPDEFKSTLGEPEENFDCIIYGASGNGKTNFTIRLLKEFMLALNCRAEYISYEEGHAKTMQDAMIHRHNMLEAVGNNLLLTDHLTYDELYAKMNKRQSPKIWVIDSLQASQFTQKQCAKLKKDFVLSRKKKIIIYISWADGKEPMGADAKAVKYYAFVKLRVEGFIVHPISRYGGNEPFVIWEGDERRGAIKHYGKEYWKITGKKKPVKQKTSKKENDGQQPAVSEGTGGLPASGVRHDGSAEGLLQSAEPAPAEGGEDQGTESKPATATIHPAGSNTTTQEN